MEILSEDAISDMATAFGTVEVGQDAPLPTGTPFSHNEPPKLGHTIYQDAIGLLPIELIAHIFQYVDHLTVIRSRRVCHKWTVLLSSTNVMHAVLRPWLAPHESFSDPNHGPTVSPSAIAARIDAFSSGRPFSVYTKSRNRDWERRCTDVFIDDTGHVAYADGFLAWIDSEADTTNLLNLWSGESKAWSFRNQADPFLLAVSDTLFAACDHFGTVTVYDHINNDEFAFRLPSANAQGIVTKGHTVAVLHDSDVIVWSAATQTARQVHIAIDSADEAISQCYGLLFVADENDLRYYQTPGDTQITFTRVPLDDTPPPEAATEEASDYAADPALEIYPIPPPTPDNIPRLSSSHGLLTLCTVQPATGTSLIGYNTSFQRLRYAQPTSGTILVGYDASHQRPRFAQIGSGNARGLLWKDVVYKSHLIATTGGRSRRLSVADCRDGSDSRWRLTGMQARPMATEGEVEGGRWSPREMSNVRLLGDEHFLVQAFTDRVVVYGFDRECGEGWRRLRR
ncbi:hypothetical protein MMC18_005560 [Xylographa bjoerkii]|nr:hypothetical protein [Xylographa bjoerkii]